MKKETLSKDGWITIAEYTSEISASIACGMLRSHGIEAVTGPDRMSTLYAGGQTWAPVTLSVPASHADEAAALLKEHGDI